MDPHLELLTQISEEQGRVAEWMRNRERLDATLATKEDLKGLASKEDVARLNNIVHVFSLGVEILGTSGKWLVYAVVTLGTIGAGILVLKGWFIGILAWLGFVHVQ